MLVYGHYVILICVHMYTFQYTSLMGINLAHGFYDGCIVTMFEEHSTFYIIYINV